ncbi:hypothetical protein SLA2020_427960 [Shorea laevis]
MKILSWNCKGLTGAFAIYSLKVKVRKLSFDIMFLTETKIDPTVACNILNNLGFFLMAHVPPSGFKGRLLLAWRHGVELECFLTDVNIVSAWCYSDPHTPWILSCLYGPPYRKFDSCFLDSISAVGDKFAVP